MLFQVNHSIAQTGPGGVGNADGTGSQPANVMWYQPSGMSPSFVSSWADNSGNGNDITQGTFAAQPSVKATTVSSNATESFNYAYFDGEDHCLPIDGSLLTNTPYTVVAVLGRRSNTLGGGGVIMGGSTGSANQNLHPYFQNATQLHYHHWGNENDYNISDGANITADGSEQFGIYVFRLNASNRSMFANGAHIGNGSNGAQLSSYTGAHIGRIIATNNYGKIDLAEFIAYSNTLNDAQVVILSNALSEKFGLSIANDIYSGTTSHNYQVAGIGYLAGSGGGQDGYHEEASSGGLSLSMDDQADFASGEYVLIGGNASSGTGFTSSDLMGSLVNRWQQDWYLVKTNNPDNAILSFDFSVGISGGQSPGDPANYKLLYRSETTDNYSEVATSAVSISGSEEISFTVEDANLFNGYYTLGTTNESDSPIAGVLPTVWYSYQNGDWNDPAVWTLNAGGINYDNPSGLTPTSNSSSQVVILNGKTVTIPSGENNYSNTVLRVEAGGILDIGATTGHTFSEIEGEGTISTSSPDDFPSFTTATDFQSKGKLQVTGSSTGLSSVASTGTFHNLQISLDNPTDEFVLTRDLVLNGGLTVTQGVFQINDDASSTRLDITVYGDVMVEGNGSIAVGRGNTLDTSIGGTTPYRLDGNLNGGLFTANLPANEDYFNMYHRVGIYGDFTNNGTVRFTNQDKPDYMALAGQTTTPGNSDAGSTASGAATVAFVGASDAQLNCNGTTDFYQLILNKGNGQTHKLTLNASQAQYFNLYGPNRLGGVTGNTAVMGPMGNYVCNNLGKSMMRKALSLLNGTLEVTGNTIILCLTNSGGFGNINSDYYIPSTAQLWLNGVNVEVYTTIDTDGAGVAYNFASIIDHLPSTYGGTPQNRLPGTLVEGVNAAGASGASALSVYGTFKISNGIFSTRNSGGFIYWPVAAGEVNVEGGYVDASVMRSSTGGGGTSSFLMSGGKITLRGNDPGNSLPGEVDGSYPTFGIINANNSFAMSGGTMDIQFSTGTGSFLVASDISNINVTGGTVRLATRDNSLSRIVSNAPFYNLELENTVNSTNANAIFRAAGNMSVGGSAFPAGDLTVLNDLTLLTGTTRTSGSNTYGTYLDLCDGINCEDVYIGGDLTINSSAVFDIFNGETDNIGSSTLTFNGVFDALLTIDDITTYDNSLTGVNGADYDTWEHPFHNVTVDKPGATLTLASTSTYADNADPNYGDPSLGKNVDKAKSNFVRVLNTFILEENSTVDLDVFSLRLYGEITNKGILGTDFTPTNAIVKTRDGGDPIIINTIDGAEFGNFRVNSSDAIVSFTSDVYCKRMEIRHGRVYLGSYNLKLDRFMVSVNDGQANFDETCPDGCLSVEDMIITDGNASDGGISLLIPADGNNPETISKVIRDSYSEFSKNDFYFPIGIGTTGDPATSVFTPVFINADAHTGGDGDEYITVNPVAKVLQTSDFSSGNILEYYWRVRTSGFDTGFPVISRMVADGSNTHLPGGVSSVDAGNFLPGKVLDNLPFTRSTVGGLDKVEILTPAIEDGVQNVDFRIDFVKPFGSGTFEDANFTAGQAACFVGQPTVFYTRDGLFASGSSCLGACDVDALEPTEYFGCAGVQWDFDQGSNGTYDVWSTTGHDGAASTTLPGAGDIMIINNCGKVVVFNEGFSRIK